MTDTTGCTIAQQTRSVQWSHVKTLKRIILTHTSSVVGFISQLHEKLQHSWGTTNCGIRQEWVFKIFTFGSAIVSNHAQTFLSPGTRTCSWTCLVWKTLDVNQCYFLHALITAGQLSVMNSQVTNCCIQLNRLFFFGQLLSKTHNTCAFLFIFSGHHRLQRPCATHAIDKTNMLYFEGYEQQLLNPNRFMSSS